jgi:hypothetical protein
VADGIHAGRKAIQQAVFHLVAGDEDERSERVKGGTEGLRSYRREWNDERKTFLENAHKDWAEHIGSSWRYLGLAWRAAFEAKPPPPPKDESVYQAMPNGTIKSNLTVREAVEAMVKRKKAGR